MHRCVVVYVSAVFLIAGCGGAAKERRVAPEPRVAFSDSVDSLAMSEPVPASEPASTSECATAAECQRDCEAGDSQACTSWGDMLYGAEPARAEALWLEACRQRDGIACLRMMALVASKPRLADGYTRHACAYGAVQACELLGTIQMLRGLVSPKNERAALLRDAAGVFEMGCGFDDWQACLSAGHIYAYEELAAGPSQVTRVATRAFELAAGACEARDFHACLFRGAVLEEVGKLDSAKEHHARGCRLYLEATPMPYAESVQEQPCRRASELAVLPPAESIEPTESPDLPIESGQVIEARRISGSRAIMPSAAVRIAMKELGRSTLEARVVLCLSPSGLVQRLRLAKSSEAASYDLTLLETMRMWRYTPYVLDGKPTPVCTVITFLYKQI